jgi:hypothetical protein
MEIARFPGYLEDALDALLKAEDAAKHEREG